MPSSTSSAPDQAQRSSNEQCNTPTFDGFPSLESFAENILTLSARSNQNVDVEFNVRQTLIGEHLSRLFLSGEMGRRSKAEQAVIVALTFAIDEDRFTELGNPWVIAGREDIKIATGWGLVSAWRGFQRLASANLIRFIGQDFDAHGRNKWELLPPIPKGKLDPRCSFWKPCYSRRARQPLHAKDLLARAPETPALKLETLARAPETEARAGRAPASDTLVVFLVSKLASFLSEDPQKGIRKWKLDWLVKQKQCTSERLDRVVQCIAEKRRRGDHIESVEGLIVHLALHADSVSLEMSQDERRQAKLPEHQQEQAALARERLAAQRVNPPPADPDSDLKRRIESMSADDFGRVWRETLEWMRGSIEYAAALAVVEKQKVNQAGAVSIPFVVAYLKQGGRDGR